MVDYLTFVTKYPAFQSIEPERFNLFLADTLQEISKHPWGDLKDRATEMLLGHLLSISSGDKSAIALESFEVDDRGYKVAYQQSEGEFETWFGKEYDRLLKGLSKNQVSAIAPEKTTFHGVRIDRSGIWW